MFLKSAISQRRWSSVRLSRKKNAHVRSDFGTWKTTATWLALWGLLPLHHLLPKNFNIDRTPLAKILVDHRSLHGHSPSETSASSTSSIIYETICRVYIRHGSTCYEIRKRGNSRRSRRSNASRYRNWPRRRLNPSWKHWKCVLHERKRNSIIGLVSGGRN